MKNLFLFLILLSVSNANAEGFDWNEHLDFQFETVLNLNPQEYSIRLKCDMLRDFHSKDQGFDVVIPACVVAGIQDYSGGAE